jgi:hypothetical protein
MNNTGKEKITAEIAVSITRHYGAEDVTLGAKIVVTVDNSIDRHAHYAKLTKALYDEHDKYAAEMLPNLPVPPNVDGATAGSGEWMPLEKIVVKVEKGKRGYFCQGGKYSRNGVRIWDETLKKYGLLDEMKETDEQAFDGWEMYIVGEAGQRKVTLIRQLP